MQSICWQDLPPQYMDWLVGHRRVLFNTGWLYPVLFLQFLRDFGLFSWLGKAPRRLV